MTDVLHPFTSIVNMVSFLILLPPCTLASWDSTIVSLPEQWCFFKAICYQCDSEFCQSNPSPLHQFSLVAQSCLTLRPHGLQHTRPPCPSPTPGACSNPCPSSRRCHPTMSSSVVPFSSCLQSFPASGSFPMSQFFEEGGQIIRASASASVLPMNMYVIPYIECGNLLVQSSS